MIYTVTFNPSLDYIVAVENFRCGAVNRTSNEKLYPGGKGMNVSIMLKNLGVESIALGFLAGFTGDRVQQLLEKTGVAADFIRVEGGMSRINVKLRSVESGTHKVIEETEVNGQGPHITESDVKKLYGKLDALQNGDILVLAGSIPSTMPASIYTDIMQYLHGKGVEIVVDAAGDLLKNVLRDRPFLVKPNNHELGEIFGVELHDKEEVICYAKKMQEQGAKNVLVSMAGEGAVLVAEDGSVYQAQAPKGTVKNSVGAGDSMVAGFLAGYLEERDYQKAFLMGLCAGSASAFSEEFGTKEAVGELYNNFVI